MRRPIVLVFVPLALALAYADAHAAGLAMRIPPLGELPPGPTRLGSLVALSVDLQLTPEGAVVTERRTYSLPLYTGGGATLTFHDSVTAGPGGSGPAVVIGGRPATGRTLAADEADALRRQLTLDLHDPAPLRELGTPLHVTDPMDVAVPFSNEVEVQVTTHVPLSQQGTMRGLVLPIDWGRFPVPSVDVKVTATSTSPLRALYSPYHELVTVRDGVNAAHATYAGRNVCPDFDLTVLCSSGDGLVHVDLVPFRYGQAEGGTFLALVTPDPTPVVGNVLPRDLVLVLDTSGSMAGAKITQAKEALRGVLQGLRPVDSFAVVTFSDVVRSFQSAAMVKANADNVAAAVSFVDGLQATGGTNIFDALHTAFGSLPSETGHPRYVVFLTDGQATVGTTGTEAIAAMAQASNTAGARLFSFGIGNDVNTVLLDRLARDSVGDVIYIRPDQSVAAAVHAFFQRIADPVLSNPTLDLAAFGAADLFPESLPDLFAGQTVTILGRYAASGRSAATLSGSRDGQAWTAALDVTLPDYALDAGYVPRIWALRQVGRLLASIKQGDMNPLLVAEIMALANRFGVTTNFTYFAANAEGDVALRYAGVPTEQTGATAVDTSTALRDYGQSGTAPGSTTQTSNQPMAVRYAADRTFLPQGGYLTDTKLTGTDIDVDLTFASDRYFAFAASEAAYGAGALLAAGTNVRFELLGRTFRITDPAALPGGVSEPPPESPAIPDPPWRPVSTATTTVVGTNVTSTGGPTSSPVADPEAPGLADRAGCACRAGSGDGGATSLWGLVALAALVRRSRRKALPVLMFTLVTVAIAGCETLPLDSRNANAQDAGGTAVVPTVPPSCIGTMASFTTGLRDDVAASVGSEWRTPSHDMALDGVSLLAGYGVDLATLETGFSVNRSSTAYATDPTLSFGGWRVEPSTARDPRAFHAAEQLWNALEGATETTDARGVTRTTAQQRASCQRGDGDRTVSITCTLTGLTHLAATEIACQ